MRFDRVGAFTYSYEASTPSADISWQVPEKDQTGASGRVDGFTTAHFLARNQAQVGRTLSVLIEGHGDNLSIGRSYRDAPEIDGLVIIPGELPLGEMVPIHIDGALVYDLTGSAKTDGPQTILLTDLG
ncbi:MAG: TRAM domain-containing protein [Chloroflexi bacterium]|nr:TRAM domain-containing protein [Chloroflexota bacterium]